MVASVGAQAGEVPYTCFSAKKSFIDKNPEKIDAILRSVTKAVKYINENDALTVAQKIASYVYGTSVSALETAIKNYKANDAWVTDMAMKETSLDRLQDIMENAGELTKRVKFSDVVLTERAHQIYTEVYA